MQSPPLKSYRPDIDGLRAVAVLPVVLCHAGLGFTGGYVGVDVFFVISGYLITGLILKSLERGDFSMWDFWERRVRRIFPALFVTVLATAIAAWAILLPDDYTSYAKSLLAVTGLGANIYFWRDTGYFAQTAEEKPLLHTWSLAVEEQFYLFVPVMLCICWRMGKHRMVRGLLALGFFSSLALGYWMTRWRPDAAYYLLPPRAWELFAGSLLAMFSTRLHIPRIIRESAGLIGIGLILWACLVYTKNTPFPGVAALAPVVGSVLLIRVGGSGGSLVTGLLSSRPFVWIGLISYSLYLWHWPLMAFVRYLSTSPPSSNTMVGVVVASIVLAWLSWRFVEAPFRHKQICASRPAILWAGAIGLSFIALVSAMILGWRGFPQRLPTMALKLDQTGRQDPTYKVDYDIHKMPESFYHLGNRTAKPSWIVWGDSFAMSFMPVAQQALTDSQKSGYGISHVSIAPVRDFTYQSSQKRADATTKNHEIFRYILSSDIQNIILVGCWHGYLLEGRQAFIQSMEATVSELSAAGKIVHVIIEPPSYSYNIKKALVRDAIQNTPLAIHALQPGNIGHRQDDINAMIAALRAKGAHVYEVDRFYQIMGGGQQFVPYDNEGAYYYDHMHLSPHGALRMLPVVKSILTDADNGK